MTRTQLKSRLTPKQMKLGQRIMKGWWLKNYHEPYVGTATEHNVRRKTTKVHAYHVKFDRLQAAETMRVALLIVNRKPKKGRG